MKNNILLGTSNSGKLKEFRYYLKYFNIFPNYEIKTLTDFEYIGEPNENGRTFEENALLKSIFFNKKTNLTSLSDDSGFIVHGLKNYPGIKTAREAKRLGGEKKVIDYIYSKLNKLSEIDATFICALAIKSNDEEIICSGKIDGKIININRGHRGFGYDPYFIPLKQNKTFAEMELNEKMMVSHRFNAFKNLSNQILSGN